MKLLANLSLTAATLVLTLAGCSSRPGITNSERGHAYRVSFRQLPPEPVYNRVSFSQLPEVMPSRDLPNSDAGVISPMVHLDLKNSTLEEASSVLAAVSRYTSYCASSIAKQRISMNTLGTVDELADQISKEANIKVVVDHDARQVRFLTGTVSAESEDTPSSSSQEPRFLSADH